MSGYTAAQLAELKANYARGVKSVQKGDERVEFRSMSEMAEIIRRIEAELAATAPARQVYPAFSRGLD